jgi:hypothetical protein
MGVLAATPGSSTTPIPAPSFYQADKQTYRRVAVVGVMFCVEFVLVSFSLRPQVEDTRVLVKADSVVRTAGTASPAH